ncbi:Wd domain-containing protein, partial [Globisporangium splendens]
MADHRKAFISYFAPHRLYGLCWSTRKNDLRVAASSFIPGEYVNKLQVCTRSRSSRRLHEWLITYAASAAIDHPYPPTKVMWSPETSGNPVEYLATTADYLRLWAVSDSSIERHATISHRSQDMCAPLTSCDWSESEPNIIGTSSIDTTCTIWDLNVRLMLCAMRLRSPNHTIPKQQIIAHDDEVYDLAFSKDANVFGSVGGDGSLRIFDLRSLESSTIMYESDDLNPLLRIAWNKQDDNFVATIVAGSSNIIILDLRNTRGPLLELNQHTASVNSISWAPHSRFHICSAAEDHTAIIYDISACTSTTDRSHSGGSGAMDGSQNSVLFRSKGPINQIRWSPTRTDCIALLDEEAAHIVQV